MTWLLAWRPSEWLRLCFGGLSDEVHQVLVDVDLPITRGAVVAAWSIIYAFQNSPVRE